MTPSQQSQHSIAQQNTQDHHHRPTCRGHTPKTFQYHQPQPRETPARPPLPFLNPTSTITPSTHITSNSNTAHHLPARPRSRTRTPLPYLTSPKRRGPTHHHDNKNNNPSATSQVPSRPPSLDSSCNTTCIARSRGVTLAPPPQTIHSQKVKPSASSAAGGSGGGIGSASPVWGGFEILECFSQLFQGWRFVM